MKISRKMTIGEFAAFIASYLQAKGISTVLTGGAVVSIYTDRSDANERLCKLLVKINESSYQNSR